MSKDSGQLSVVSGQQDGGDGKKAEDYFFRASAADFKKIPGSPIAYWVSESMANAFTQNKTFGKLAETLQGMTTCDNDFYLRFFWEVSLREVGFRYANREAAQASRL